MRFPLKFARSPSDPSGRFFTVVSFIASPSMVAVIVSIVVWVFCP